MGRTLLLLQQTKEQRKLLFVHFTTSAGWLAHNPFLMALTNMERKEVERKALQKAQQQAAERKEVERKEVK